MEPGLLLTYTVALVMIGAGALLALGIIGPPTTEPQLRVVVGVILLLMGVYRLVLARARRADRRRRDRFED